MEEEEDEKANISFGNIKHYWPYTCLLLCGRGKQ